MNMMVGHMEHIAQKGKTSNSATPAEFIEDVEGKILRAMGVPAHLFRTVEIGVHDEFAQIGLIESNENMYPLLPSK